MPNFKKQKAENDAFKAQKKAEIKEGLAEFQRNLPPKTPLILVGLGAAALSFVFFKGIKSIISGDKKGKVQPQKDKKPNLLVEGAKDVAVTLTVDTAKKIAAEYLERIFVSDEKSKTS